MASSDPEKDDRNAADMMREASDLMERALKLLDMANEDLTAAKLDDAICSLNLRENLEEKSSGDADGTS